MTSSKTRRELRDVSEMERRRSSPASCVRVLLYQYHLWGPSRYRKTKRARVPALSRVAPARIRGGVRCPVGDTHLYLTGRAGPRGVRACRAVTCIRQRYFSQTLRHEAIDYVGLYRVLCRLARSWEHRSAELGELRAAQVGIVAATRE